MRFNRNVKALAELGPLTRDELPTTIGIGGRKKGIRRFDPSEVGVSGGTLGVYHLEQKHGAGEVVKKWLDANGASLETVSERSVHRRIAEYDDGFGEASARALGPFDAPNDGGEHEPEPCPLGCGAEIRSLGEHIPECPERDGA